MKSTLNRKVAEVKQAIESCLNLLTTAEPQLAADITLPAKLLSRFSRHEIQVKSHST